MPGVEESYAYHAIDALLEAPVWYAAGTTG